jgi:RNA polymerase sigma-70 factor (ECF subfamily)
VTVALAEPRDLDTVFAAAQQGDAAALDELLRRHRTQAVRYAMRLCISPADAEDAAQEALLALARYIGALRAAAALSSWIFTAVRTHCYRLARRSLRGALGGAHAAEIADLAPGPDDILVEEQLRTRLAEVMAGLDETPREILLRRDVLGQPARQVASDLGISVEAVKSRLHRARADARAALLASIGRPRPKP